MLNIGILHGCFQNSEIVSVLMKDYIKKIKSGTNDQVAFHFLNAQYKHPDKGLMWYETVLDLDRIGTNDIPDTDVQNTLDYVESWIMSNQITILIGFSQGGNVVSTYLRLRNNDRHISTAAIISGYDFPRYTDYSIPYIGLILVHSEEDKVVDYRLTPKTSLYHCILKHEKGHIICCRSSFVTSFVNELLM